MQITQRMLPLLPLLHGFGLSRHVRGWRRFLAWLFPHDKQKSRRLATKRWGLTYLANPANYIDWNVLCFGGYETESLKLFKLYGKPHAVCLDIGGNVGHHAIYFGSLDWVVHSFDPNPQLWVEFGSKVAASGLANITLHGIGLGAEDAFLEFGIESIHNSGTGRFAYRMDDKSSSDVPVGRLPVRNGDRYLEEAGIYHVDVIKMDIQGFEPEALTGLRCTIKRDTPFICIEISPDNIEKFRSFDEFRAFLPSGYSFKRVRSRTAGLFRWTRVEDYAGEDFTAMNGNLLCIATDRELISAGS